jgi:hypothetical protein
MSVETVTIGDATGERLGTGALSQRRDRMDSFKFGPRNAAQVERGAQAAYETMARLNGHYRSNRWSELSDPLRDHWRVAIRAAFNGAPG